MKKSLNYFSPDSQVIAIENEKVLCSSDFDDFEWGVSEGDGEEGTAIVEF